MKPQPKIIGINHDFPWSEPKEDDQLIALMKAAGVTHVRMPIRWVTVEPAKGRRDFARIDVIIEKLTKAHIGILGSLMSFPAWSNGTEGKKLEGWFDTYPPEGVADWGRYVATVVRRYRKEIHHWEIWNEQNGVDFWRPLPDVDQFMRFLKSAYRACKAADPSCTVVLGGLQMNGVIANPWSPVKTPNFLQAIYDAGGRRWFDVANIHPYSLPRPEEGAEYMIRMIKDTIAVMAKNGDAQKPLWVTEIGCGTNELDTPAAQAKLLEESFRALYRLPQIAAVFWFTLKDYDRAIVGPEDSMGILTAKLAPKPAYEALKRIAAELNR